MYLFCHKNKKYLSIVPCTAENVTLPEMPATLTSTDGSN